MAERQHLISEEVRYAIDVAVREAIAKANSDRIAYTIDQAAEAVGIHRNTMRDAVSRGELRAVKRGRRWLISREALVRWVTPGR